MDARTPEEISEKILELCQQLAPTSHAVLWTFLASHAGDCFLNVQQKVQRLRFRVLQLGNVSNSLAWCWVNQFPLPARLSEF